MTSTPDKLKQEPPQDDFPMDRDDDGEQEQENSSGLSNQTDGSQPSQKDTNQVTQNNENQPGQKDTNDVGQNNGEQPGQINVNQATQNNETQPGQKDTNDVGLTRRHLRCSLNMTSTPDKLKQEPPQDDVPMGSDDGTEQEQENNSGLSNQTDGSQPSQQDTNQVTQNNENQPGQQDVNHGGQNNGEQPGQNNVNQSTQSNGEQPGQNNVNQTAQNDGKQPGQNNGNQSTQNTESRPGQKDTNHVGQINGNQSTNENPFLSGFFKRKVDKDNSANNARAFSPVVEDPNAKKAKTDHSFSFHPSAKAKTAPFSPRAQTTTRTSPFPEDDGVGDPDLEKDLVGSQACPENMTTLGLVKEGKRPRYLNEHRIDGRSILRIETLKDGKFDENAAEVLPVTGGKYQALHADKKWRDVDYVLGVAAFGSELNYEEFLCKLDPENPSKFKWMQTILIGIRWVDQTVTFVNRQWWRNNYAARDLSAKQTYLDRKEDGYRYWYKTRDDPEWRTRVNHKAFEDYRLFKWAFLAVQESVFEAVRVN
ncbi:hypothetical protein FOTG_18381 [Fusarium oxysporum f. sp. vasinfectum 25433]|uniref:Uncharacterized protein n=1 Tax=Fusarium oxysporum f. sp. vasinfectum 25433 TaxID=1089449 RepID=X0KHQ6_FUSOX|nr:hypothetical protein FOTG_18381 [Fusarium oxysporum f. sp. vasinfectum 25433]